MVTSGGENAPAGSTRQGEREGAGGALYEGSGARAGIRSEGVLHILSPPGGSDKMWSMRAAPAAAS